MANLNKNREYFCNYYIESGNASEAYRKAYPKSVKWKEEAVWAAGSNLLKNEAVSERINELQEELKNKSDIKKEEVLQMLRNIMYADIRDFLEIKNGNVVFKDSAEWTEKMAMQVESVKQTKEGIEIKLNGKAWSIQRICKMLGFDEPVKTITSIKTIIGDE